MLFETKESVIFIFYISQRKELSFSFNIYKLSICPYWSLLSVNVVQGLKSWEDNGSSVKFIGGYWKLLEKVLEPRRDMKARLLMLIEEGSHIEYLVRVITVRVTLWKRALSSSELWTHRPIESTAKNYYNFFRRCNTTELYDDYRELPGSVFSSSK